GMRLGSGGLWVAGEDPERHLEMGVALARQIGRPFLEFTGLAYQTAAGLYRSFTRAAERGRQAIELARRHGWDDEPAVGLACVILGAMLAWQMRPGEAGLWVQRAERVLRAETEPGAVLGMRYTRGVLELAHGRDADALAAFQAAERLAGRLAAPHMLLTPARAWLLHVLVRLGDVGRAERALANLGERDREHGEIRIAAAVLRLAQDDPRAAMAAVAPVLDGSAPLVWSAWLVEAFLLEAIARDALGDPGAAGRALERALDLAEPDGVLLWFVLHPAPGLLQRHARPPSPPPPLAPHPPHPRGRPAPRPPRGAATAAGAAERQRDPGAALPADQPVGAADRQRAVRLAQHHQDPHAPPVRQARHAPPVRDRRARPCPGPAGTLPAPAPGDASRLTPGQGPAIPAGLNRINDGTPRPPAGRPPGSGRQSSPDALIAGRRSAAAAVGALPCW